MVHRGTRQPEPEGKIGGSTHAAVAVVAVGAVVPVAETAVGHTAARRGWGAFEHAAAPVMRVLGEQKVKRKLYFVVKLKDAKRDLPVEGLLLYTTIHQSAELEQNIPEVRWCMALIPDVVVLNRHLRNIVVVGKTGCSAKWRGVADDKDRWRVPVVGVAAVVDTAAGTGHAAVPDGAEEVDRSAAYTSVDPAVSWDKAMDQLAEL